MKETWLYLKKCHKCKKDMVIVREDDVFAQTFSENVYYAEDGVIKHGRDGECSYCGEPFEE